MTSSTPSSPETYPCEVPIKAMGLAQNNFAALVVEIVRRHLPEVGDAAISQWSQRFSANQKYLSVTVTIIASSRAQLEVIYADLKASGRVLMVL